MASEDRRATASPPVDLPLGSTIALGVLISLGALFLLAPLLWRILPVTPLPAPFPSHHQDAETAIFVLSFGALMPLGILGARRIGRAIDAGPNAASFDALVGVLAVGLALVVIGTRISAPATWGGGPAVLAALTALWCVLAVALVTSAVTRASPLLQRVNARTALIWTAAAVLVVPLALAFTDLGSISIPVLAVGGVLTVGAVAGWARRPSRSLTGGWGRAVDLGLVLLLVLAIPNLFVVAAGDPATALDTSIVQFHQNFYLGPANQVLAGDAVLVDVISQYGVGSIYFLVAAFHVVPIGNGTLGLVEGGLSVLMFVGTLLTLRLAGVSRTAAAVTMGVAVVALVYGLQNPLGALLQHGAIRFGLPVGVLLAAVVEARIPRVARPARAAQLLVVAIAATWALEGFAYAMLVALVVAVARAATLPRARRQALVRSIALLAGAIVVGHLVFAAGTVAYAGELPDWSWYINTLREFLFGGLGDWTYDFSSFSPGLAIGALYLASGSAITVILLRRRDLHARHRPMLVAIAGTTAWGVALLSYIVNRGADHIVPYVSLPVVALGALWLTFLDTPALRVSEAGRRTALAISLGLATVVVAAAWPTVGDRYPESALAHVVPGGPSLPTALRTLWDPPPLRSTSPEGAALLEEHMPGQGRSIVLTSADLSVEILVRAGRGNAVPLGDPWEDSFVPGQHLDPLGEFVSSLDGGERMLLDGPARTAYDAYRVDPGRDPLTEAGNTAIVPAELASLQKWVLREIGLRFDLRSVTATESGFEIVELVLR